MKRLILILLILNTFQACSQKKGKKENIKAIEMTSFSGEYSGKFTDLKNAKGTINLYLYQSNHGSSEGIIIIKKNNDKDKLVTGIIRVTRNGKFINGNFNPSVIKNYVLYTEETESSYTKNSYECNWNFYGEIKGESGNLIIGKAVPMNCSESNLMEFTLERNK